MDIDSVISDLATANRILANEGVLDQFGHVTARHPDGDKMIVSSYQSPALVEEDDLIQMTLEGEILTDGVDEIYSENVIHRAIYRNRDDVNTVVHCHAEPLIPFTVTDVEIRPVTHLAAPFHEGVPVFDEYDEERGRLIVTEPEGERMANVLGERRAQLLKGHGANVVGESVREAIALTMHLVTNARHQLDAENLGSPSYFTEPEEMLEATTNDIVLKSRTIDRVWDYHVNRLEDST